MKTHPYKPKLSALIGFATLKSLQRQRNWRLWCCVICGLIFALPASTTAAMRYLTSGTLEESDATYTGAWNASVGYYAAPIEVYGADTVYSGTRITLLGATPYNSNAQKGAVVGDHAAFALYDSVITGGTITWGHGVVAMESSTVLLDHVDINLRGSWAYGVTATSSTVTVRDVSISGTQFADRGLHADDHAVVHAERINITLGDYWSMGLLAEQSGTIFATSGTITMRSNGNPGAGNAVTIGIIARRQGSVVVNDFQIFTTGSESFGAGVEGGGYVELNNVEIESQGLGASRGAIYAEQENSLLVGNGVTVVSDQRGATVSEGTMELRNSSVTATGTDEVLGATSGDIIVNGGTLAGGGDVLAVSGSGGVNVALNDVELSGAGGITANDVFTGTGSVDINGGSGINGDLTNSGSGALTVNFNNSAITGDVINAGDGVLVVTLDNNSIGTGGYNGGNLITGSNSVWTFDKDSHGNYGQNDGVWNIGDYEVIFDNMTHTGTVTISVNSDTGEGGSIIITNTADGEGTVHIDTTGDGQLNPNDVLPGIVSGDGTEHWQWDPIDWGIDTIIKDGDHFIKSGVSPAGAVLNSSVAIQQAMWFAQQNSLLKRMGELRYGARASRPLADKDVRVPYHNLIENLWLRSYGQQLNVGSQVAGHAYEQLIYGVDLGTDHKFTISADSDLYLGVYAGYGRSDIDYRTPGTDGEINSYYGGLYATWLHSSGFYIDATFKAASVDNNLKAPYGNAQLKASYNDVNLGGSIEIGKKFTFADEWFIEPQLQVNYLHILAENYTAGPLTISAQDLDALQFRIGSVFGRTINLTNSGALQPYIKISGVETISTGGTLHNGYQSTRANTDGARAELGGGLIWQLDADNQLHLDYEASFGDKYDKPWGLSAGYRHQF
jgi:outer membrane autotransporter protein